MSGPRKCPSCLSTDPAFRLKPRTVGTTLCINRFHDAPKKDPRVEPNYDGKCETCGASPIIPATGMCGPCTFGEADTEGGNW